MTELKIFAKDESFLLQAKYDDKQYTFYQADKVYIVVTEINEGGLGQCFECKSTDTKSILVGRDGSLYKVRYCNSCGIVSLENYKKMDKNDIPLNIIDLINMDWQGVEIADSMEGAKNEYAKLPTGNVDKT